jgi:hypothetical protein
MAKFVVGRPLTTRESSVVVDAGLPVGIHRFQLIVIGANGVASKPDQVLVQVQATRLIPGIRTPPVIPLPPLPLPPITPLSPRTPRRKGKPS